MGDVWDLLRTELGAVTIREERNGKILWEESAETLDTPPRGA